MSWTITPQQKIDPDAAVYLSRVETADGQVLEAGVRTAVDQFVLGCKADGIWPAIKASCILAGARTVSGALIPLAGVDPINNNFVSGDYNRKTGLAGGAGRYIAANRAGNADPQNNTHISIYVSTAATSGAGVFPPYIGHQSTPQTIIFRNQSSGSIGFRCQTSTADSSGDGSQVGLIGLSRAASASFVFRASGSNTTITRTSEVSTSTDYQIVGSATGGNNGRFAFYSIGESLNLTLLDTRVTALINAFGTAIP